MQEILGRNLYFSFCLFALIGGIATYLFFYNKESLSLEAVEGGIFSLEEESSEIVVDISGAVDRPGVFTLESGSRLADLLNFAGGVTTEVSKKWLSRNLNLASILKDQQKIYIPFEWEVVSSFPEYELKELALESSVPSNTGTVESVDGGATSTGSSSSGTNISSGSNSSGETSENTVGSLINLNSASKSELETLPKVGTVTAGKIIDFRPYVGFEDLKEKTGIYDSVIEAIKELVTF